MFEVFEDDISVRYYVNGFIVHTLDKWNDDDLKSLMEYKIFFSNIALAQSQKVSYHKESSL